jgi:hypothetical protein
MPIEASLLKPIVDAILGLARSGSHARLKHDAAKAVREAIRELLLADPNESEAEAKIAIAKAAGLISEDVLLADDMLRKVRAGKKSTLSRIGKKRTIETPTKETPRKTAKKPAAKHPPAKK